MKKGQILEGIIEQVKFPNKGIINITEQQENQEPTTKTVVVKDGAPGQKVRFSVNKIRKGKGEGRIIEVLEKSPIELSEPNCIHFGKCGGCTYQNLSYEEQLKIKETQVREMLDEVIITDDDDHTYQFEGIKGSPNQFGYRNKMEFSFGDEVKDGPLALGMHKKGSFHDIVTVPGCKITDEDFSEILSTVLKFFQEKQISFYHKMRHEGYLRHLLVRKGSKTGEILVCLVTSSQQQVDLSGMVEALTSLKTKGKLVGILHIINDSLADVVQSDETIVLYGQDYFYEELLGLKFKISPFSFFQTNSLGAEVLYETAREYVGDLSEAASGKEPSQVVFDLYSGTGTIAQMLAPVAKKVIGVEIVKEAVEAAKENAQLNGLDNCEFIAGDVLKVLDDIEEKPDFIVLDPPRDGIHPRALDKIIEYGVEKMVYISCKPTSLVRDLYELQESGYKVVKACAVDMFPGTVHVETVVLLSQQKPSDRIEVDLDMDEMDATSAEMKDTYAEIKDYVLKEHGLKVSNLYISQVKRKYGIEVGENYNLAKSEDARQPNCPAEKEKAIKEALEHFGMIL